MSGFVDTRYSSTTKNRLTPLMQWFEVNIGPSWRSEALCAQTDPEAFFPGKGGSTQEAKRVCADCTVRKQCLDWAVEHDERFGIWGGMSERERRRYKKRMRAQRQA